MSETEIGVDQQGRLWRLRYWAAIAVGTVICESKLRLGRWRHDHHCDRCEKRCGTTVGERLDFSLDDLSPDASTTREKLWAMLTATYERTCLSCAQEAKQ